MKNIREGVSREGIPSIIILTCVTVSQCLGVLAEMPCPGHGQSNPRWRNVTAASFIAYFFGCMMELLKPFSKRNKVLKSLLAGFKN